jgi:outer membrane protein TolC
LRIFVVLALSALAPMAAHGQPTPAQSAAASPTLTLPEALELALVRNYGLALAQLDIDGAHTQIEQAWGSVYPRVDLSLRYTRTLRAPNPFAGSAAGGLFDGFDAIGWLAYNESARTAGGQPISLADYQQRNADGLDAAGIEPAADNPFLVENAVNAGINVTQTLYNGAAFAAIRGAESYQRQVESTLRAQQQEVAQQVSETYYGALLAQAQVAVLHKSVERTRDTVSEVTERVSHGVLPTFQQLSAEVELNNLQTSLIQARAREAAALDALKVIIGLPPSEPITLRDTLTVTPFNPQPIETALQTAIASRPDLETLRRSMQLLEVQRELTEARNLPVISAFANIGLQGSVPDDRTSAVPDRMVPFRYSKDERGVFDGDYWNDSANIGLSLTWNLFDGFQTSQQIQLDQLATRRLAVRYQQALDGVRMSLQASLRDLETARELLANQDQNIARAELNDAHARARVAEGVSTQLELRQASQQLDLSQLNRLQAVHTYLNAVVRYRIAIGQPPVGSDR